MLVSVYGAKCIGIEAVKVTVEIEMERGIGLNLVGLADAAVKESLLRTCTALTSLGYRIPGLKIVINLAPADLRKNGSGYDLPIAVGIIAASSQAEMPDIGKYLMMGELGLDGSLRPVPGALPFAELASSQAFEGIILPERSALEAVDIEGIKVFAATNLNDVVRILSGTQDCTNLLVGKSNLYAEIQGSRTGVDDIPDFADIVGQEGAKRAAEIAAAGGHNLFLTGSPGSGKSSLAKAIAGILPEMTMQESLVTSKIYSVAGKGAVQYGLIRKRPFRSPHCSSSLPAMIGGGAGDNIVPGEVSLATNGVLFLDEMTLMPKTVIEALRAPLEDRYVTISRLRSKVVFPASFTLVAASNPCPCGYYGDGDRCVCTPYQRIAYLKRFSGPLLDRVDLQCRMYTVTPDRILEAGKSKAEPSRLVASRVQSARQKQIERFRDEPISTNAEMNNRQIERYCVLSDACRETLGTIMERMHLSMRAYFRIIKVARTIADLADSEEIEPSHLLEAASYRFLDRRNFQ